MTALCNSAAEEAAVGPNQFLQSLRLEECPFQILSLGQPIAECDQFVTRLELGRLDSECSDLSSMPSGIPVVSSVSSSPSPAG